MTIGSLIFTATLAALLVPSTQTTSPDPGGWHPGTAPIRFLARIAPPPTHPALPPPLIRIPTPLPDRTYRIFENDKHLGLLELDPSGFLVFPPPPSEHQVTRLFHLYPLREPVASQLIATPAQLSHGQIVITPTTIATGDNLPILQLTLPPFTNARTGPTQASVSSDHTSILILAGFPMAEFTLPPNTTFTATLAPAVEPIALNAEDPTAIPPPVIVLKLPNHRVAVLSSSTLDHPSLHGQTITFAATTLSRLRLDILPPTTALADILAHYAPTATATVETFPPQPRIDGMPLRPPCPDCVAALEDSLPPALRQRRNRPRP